VLRCNNATALTITGFSAGYDGQRIFVQSIGAGQVDLSHQAAGSTAANRLINYATVANSSLAAGVGVAEYVYDATTARWRLVAFQQGAWIAYTPTFKGSTSNPTIGNATLSGRYMLVGRMVTFDIYFVYGSTTVAGTGTYSWDLPATAADILGQTFATFVLDSGTATLTVNGMMFNTTSVTVSSIPAGASASPDRPADVGDGRHDAHDRFVRNRLNAHGRPRQRSLVRSTPSRRNCARCCSASFRSILKDMRFGHPGGEQPDPCMNFGAGFFQRHDASRSR
jgi:hypothetical protein